VLQGGRSDRERFALLIALELLYLLRRHSDAKRDRSDLPRRRVPRALVASPRRHDRLNGKTNVMKQTRPVKAPSRARLNALIQQDLRAATGGHNGTIVVENLLGTGGAVVSQGVGGTGFLPDD